MGNDMDYDDKYDALLEPCIKWLRDVVEPSYLGEYGTLLLKMCRNTIEHEAWNLAMEKAALICQSMDVAGFGYPKGYPDKQDDVADIRLRLATAIRYMKTHEVAA